MSYLNYSSQIAHHDLSNRSFGIAFVVLLHIGAIVAIGNGLGISVDQSGPPVAKISPIRDAEQPKLPVEPVDITQRGHTRIVIDSQRPILNVMDLPKDNGDNPTPIEAGHTADTAQPVIIAARVDATHPLTQPPYPAQARRMGQQGRVELLLYVLANGRVGEAKIAQSSGYMLLDEAAINEALRAWRFIPQQTDGNAVASWQRLAISFRLK